jgi:hypothetical protein
MCVIIYTEIDGKIILAKNRDQVHKPNIEIIHEIINGIEIAYIRDIKTEWVEGMNENGCGIVNATLNRNEGKVVIKFKNSYKKNKIFNILSSNKTNNEFYDYIKRTNDKGYTFEGNTILVNDDKVFHIENTKNVFLIEKIDKSPAVYTNHGINIKDAGFTEGRKGFSSFLRKKLVETELKCNKDVDLYDDFVSNIMNVNYTNIDPRFHSYRDKKLSLKQNNIDKNQKFISTTGQLILNITDKELVYYADVNNSETVKYINRLPSNYAPKIRVIIKETKKNIKRRKNRFTQKYLRKLHKKFNYNSTRREKTMNKNTRGKNMTRKKRLN